MTDTYDVDADGFLLGKANPKRGYPGPVTIAPPAKEVIPGVACKWDGATWISDTTRLVAQSRQKIATQAVLQIQANLDSVARSWGYDNILSASTYAGDAYAKFDAEGTTLRDWRSATWEAVDKHQDAATVEELLSYLPAEPARPR